MEVINKTTVDVLDKEKLINLWEFLCRKTISDPDSFIVLGTSSNPNYTIRISDTLSMSIDGNSIGQSYTLTLIFSDIIRYKFFVIDSNEFEKLLEIWETGLNRVSKLNKENKINEGLIELNKLIVQFEQS